ncbi:MAG: right-handed parallel beta-helix repeat-containing protein [Flavobacteriales bacterium]|nr:right-handed parallel beta-helix repeat-containing protein [Flavobacteriales bacterium]
MRFSLFILGLLWTLLSHATDYYVSPSGNDGSNGTSPSTAWKTITKVNQFAYSLQPGDRVLFMRGGTWRGEVILPNSGTAAQPITLGAYGTGAKPVIKGSETVGGWTVHQGNIWRANLTAAKVPQVYVNGSRMTLARYPNTGWLENDNGGGNQLQSNDLNQSNGYWNGATCVLRSSNWSFDTMRVSNYSNGTLQFTSSVTYLANNPWGFYMRNKLSELDSPGEWYYDKAAQRLYLWPHGGGNPNSMTVEAAVYNNGVNCYWQRNYLKVQDLEFRHQIIAGIRNDGANNVTISGCTFRDLYHGISSAGQASTVSGNDFRDTYATAAFLLDNNALVEGNTCNHIAMLEGEGESIWGYFGIRAIGSNTVIRGNRLDSTGYIGISAENNALVERNVVLHAVALLNDGGSIAIDHADGLIIQDNIVGDPIGRLDNGVALVTPYHENMTMGIYFGNTSIQNTTVQRNTVYGCHGAGIHVDHTMLTSGIQVKDNVLFNNDVQLSMSDYSNNVGTGATPPYHVANYNDVYSGNIMYCLKKEQLCVQQHHIYSADPVDFGTYSNNRYFNPYNELSIKVINFIAGDKWYTLERWKADRNEDAGSKRSPLRLAEYSTAQELSGNLVVKGNFNASVDGWTGWPTNAQLTRIPLANNNGALKVYLPDASMYPSLSIHQTDYFPIQNGSWYRVRFNQKSNAFGQFTVGIKGQSTVGNPYTTWQRDIPFSRERRNLEMYFQSGLTDQAWIQFTNTWTEPMYYMDNVEVTRVNVQPLDPHQRHKLFVNDQPQAQTYTVPAGCWKDVNSAAVQGSFTLQPYTSKVIYRVDQGCTAQAGTGSVALVMGLGGALQQGDTLMHTTLQDHGLLPATEPYSAMGFAVANAGAVWDVGLMEGEGDTTVVDWVLVQLHENNAAFTALDGQAALLRSDGRVIAPDGAPLITFEQPVDGRLVSVMHRNHLGVLCTAPLTGDGELVDFTRTDLPVFGNNAQAYNDGHMVLWPGDVSCDGEVKLTGKYNDRDAIMQLLGGPEPERSQTGYSQADVNLDGKVIYSGANNDRNPILQTIGGTAGTAVRKEMMP